MHINRAGFGPPTTERISTMPPFHCSYTIPIVPTLSKPLTNLTSLHRPGL